MRRRGNLTEADIRPLHKLGLSVSEAAGRLRVTGSAIRHWERVLGIRFRSDVGGRG